MKNPERVIFVPLGDKTHENLERAASYEAWKLALDITEGEKNKGRQVYGMIESLQKHPRVNSIYYLKKKITSMGGFLVKIEEIKNSRRI